MLRRSMSTLTTTTLNRRSKAQLHYAMQTSTAYAKKMVMSSSPSSVSIFKTWPTDAIESHGDYRQEAWLEEYIGGPLYENQSKLPRLPVCDIATTLQTFLPTALPLARNKAEVSELQQAVQSFPSQASVLQQRLVSRANDDFRNSSWLQLWWNTAGYLQVRDTVVINVSYFFHFADDPTAPSQVQRAAAILTAVGDFRKLVASGQLPAEVIGRTTKQPLCAAAYKYMFHACRIPALEQDSYKMYDPSLHHHAVVAVQGHFFKMDLVDPVTQDPVPLHELETSLRECQEQAARLLIDDRSPEVRLGWCTSSNRDDWATARIRLLEQGGVELQQALRDLESGAVLLCLDDDRAVSRTEVAQMLLHGSVSTTGGNRWFDKSIQLVVSANGKAGLVGEHSMMDGMPMVRLADHITKTTYADCQAKSQQHQTTVTSTVQPIFSQAVRDKIRSTAAPLVSKAKEHFSNLVTNNSLHVQSFQGYGSAFMKQAGYSPDAYVQVAMQLATFRLWGEQAGTYEATQVRPFLHGRTETTRTVSSESSAFVQRMGLRPAWDEHDASARKEKLQLLRDAVQAHVKYTGQAAKAQGVDRHFFGLSMLVQDGDTTPDLYADPVFVRSKRWRVSTSHLTHPKFDGWGYGQVVPDGVGLAYSIHPRHCIFNITALKETGWTDKLSQLLEEALLELRTLVEMDMPPPASKI